MVSINPMVTKRVATELFTGLEAPFGFHGATQWRGKQRAHVPCRLAQLLRHMLLAELERGMSRAFFVAEAFLFQTCADARAQKNGIEWFGQIILGAHLDAARNAILL